MFQHFALPLADWTTLNNIYCTNCLHKIYCKYIAQYPTLCFTTSRLSCPTKYICTKYIAQIACTKYITHVPTLCFTNQRLNSSALDSGQHCPVYSYIAEEKCLYMHAPIHILKNFALAVYLIALHFFALQYIHIAFLNACISFHYRHRWVWHMPHVGFTCACALFVFAWHVMYLYFVFHYRHGCGTCGL